MSQQIQPVPDAVIERPTPRVPASRPFAYKRIVDLPQSAPFPKSLFAVREYNSWKAFSLIVLMFALISFAQAFIEPVAAPENFTKPVQEHYDNRGWIKRGWEAVYGWAWQKTPPETVIREEAHKQIAWGRWCSGIGVIVAWLFVWLCFDWRNARTMIYGLFLIGFGVVYAASPLDLIPDAVPFFGVLDDAAMLLFGGGLGLASIIENAKKRKQDSYLREIMRENPSAAVSIVLKDYGLTIEDASAAHTNDG